MEDWNGPPATEFDADFAKGFLGKYLLVAINYYASNGDLESQIQVHGTVRSITPEGLDLALQGVREGTVWRMPPYFLDEFEPGQTAVYTLRATGEKIEDPDFTFVMRVNRARPQ